MRRKPGQLLPLEVTILGTCIAAAADGDEWQHGYALATRMRDGADDRRLTAHGTLYKALARLDDGGLLEHRWESADDAAAAGRPRRRLYRVTGTGRVKFAEATAREPSLRLDPGTVS